MTEEESSEPEQEPKKRRDKTHLLIVPDDQWDLIIQAKRNSPWSSINDFLVEELLHPDRLEKGDEILNDPTSQLHDEQYRKVIEMHFDDFERRLSVVEAIQKQHTERVRRNMNQVLDTQVKEAAKAALGGKVVKQLEVLQTYSIAKIQLVAKKLGIKFEAGEDSESIIAKIQIKMIGKDSDGE